MNDPKRLSEGSGSDVERTLLRAGRAGAPQGAKSRAMLVASGAMAASSLAAAGAAAEGTVAAAKVGSIVALKWIGALTVASASALTGAAAMRNAHVRASRDGVAAPSASTPAVAHAVDQRPISAGPAKSDLPAAPAPSIAPADPSIAPPPSPVPAAAPANVRSPPVRADLGGPPVSTLSAELAALDQARTALAAGEAPRSLGILDHYYERFPRGAMAPEADVLRIEVLLQAGDRAAAQRAADAFLAGRPKSPYAPRIRSLLSASNP